MIVDALYMCMLELLLNRFLGTIQDSEHGAIVFNTARPLCVPDLLHQLVSNLWQLNKGVEEGLHLFPAQLQEARQKRSF